jgi:hypothetical protein
MRLIFRTLKDSFNRRSHQNFSYSASLSLARRLATGDNIFAYSS